MILVWLCRFNYCGCILIWYDSFIGLSFLSLWWKLLTLYLSITYTGTLHMYIYVYRVKMAAMTGMATWGVGGVLSHLPLIPDKVIVVFFNSGKDRPQGACARYPPNVVLMLGQRLRRWPNITTTLVQTLAFSVYRMLTTLKCPQSE